MANFRYCMCLAVVSVLAGCTGYVRNESPGCIARSVKQGPTPDGKGTAWFGPEMEQRRYRTLFYGYDVVYYRLAAQKPPGSSAIPTYRLLIDAHYGGNLRHYDLAKFADGSSRATADRQHTAERCQFFNNLIYACLFRDRAGLSLSRSELEHARTGGLQLVLSSGTQDYERIDLPANYIQGFLQAVR